MPTSTDPATTTADLVAELRRAGVREVTDSTLVRAEYSSDASLYRVPPRVVVTPRDTDEVVSAMAVCRAQGVPITARGAGTSIAGNAVGPGVVFDFSRHLNRVLSIDRERAEAVVQPGVVLDALQREARPHALRFGPDPSTHNRCTLGGMIGNNACGSRALGYGRTADNVRGLDVITGSGERLHATAGADPASSPTLTELHRVVSTNLRVIRTELGRFGRQISGYSLEHLLPENGFNVAKALVGTEGTCGIVLGATLRLVPAPATSTLVVLGYPDMASAADAVPTLLPHGPTALEGLDARIVEAVRSRKGADRMPALPAGSGWLFVELSGDTTAEVLDTARRLVADAGTAESLIVDEPAQATALWRIREDGAGLSARSERGTPAHAGWEDAAVPPERLGTYLREFDALLTEYGLAGMPYGHFGDGCMHIRIDFPLAEYGGRVVFRDFMTDAAKLVAAHGGSCSGEHGDGRTRGELLPLMYSADAIAAFGAMKAVFDPGDLLNPGIIVRPVPIDANLRVPAASKVRRSLGFGYHDDRGDFSTAVHRCTGVGKCIADSTASGGVMCPSYLATGAEKDSTRGRARVLQEMLNGSLVSKGWRSPEVHEALDLCLSCKGCVSDCPTGVDMAAYKAEVLHQTYRNRLRPASHYSLGWLPYLARLTARTPRLANRAMATRPLATLAKRLGGIDARRKLPRFAEQSFRQWFDGRIGAPVTGDPVLLWVDTFTNYFTPEVGIAAVRLLDELGLAVRIPRHELCCGLTWISTGQLDTARRVLRRSVSELRGPASAGIPVLGLEPSCSAVFRGDAMELLDSRSESHGASAVSAATHTLAELLAAYRPEWTPPDLSDVDIVVQPHCHQHAVLGWQADSDLLRRTGAGVRSVGGCCGLAGNFGAERGHYDVSVAVAETALLPAVREAGEDTVLLADGFSCRTQLDALVGRRGLHLAELLAGQR